MKFLSLFGNRDEKTAPGGLARFLREGLLFYDNLITNRSTRTVESVKYQLKKKLGLTAEDSLEKYLNSLKM